MKKDRDTDGMVETVFKLGTLLDRVTGLGEKS